MVGVCNYLGIRKIMADLPNYKHQSTFNEIEMQEWRPEGPTSMETSTSKPSGAYKCLLAETGSEEGNLCYLEIEEAGHVLSVDKPSEGSVMISKWMRDLSL